MTKSPTADGSPLEKLQWIAWAQIKAGQNWLRERELSPQQSFVLSFLVEHPGSIQRQIAHASSTTAANVSGVLRVLEGRGLITRTSDGDDRSKRVFATPSGAALIEGRDEAMAAADESLLTALDPSERATLTALLDKIAARLTPPGT